MASTTIAELARFQIPLKDIQEATNNFHDDNIIAEGVYKGKLLRSEKRVKIFACKHLASGEDIEFLKEVSLLSVLKHKNIVSLIGFCDEKDEKIIVIAHERKGSLNVSLNNPILTWTQRLRISLSVARALNYLHYELPYSVIHQNINSYTILLDENWEPKLSGFSIHIKQPVQQRHEVVHSKTIGPSGYIDPEIEKRGGVTLNSDIYSFGVVLFEILCGKSAYNNEAKWPLAQLAKHHYENRKLKDIINPQVWSQILSPKQLAIYSTIAYDCLKEPGYRPNLQYIIEQLTEALNLQHLREKLIKNLEHLKIRVSVIQVATDNFSETHKTGSSKYLNFYEAQLNHFPIDDPSYTQWKNKGEHAEIHKNVAIKRIKNMQYEDFFYRNIRMLTSVEHHNIEALLGFCVDGSEMILVTDNICNNYLDDYLGNVNRMCILTWENRLKICIDVARLLDYLHSRSMPEDEDIIINNYMNGVDRIIINNCINRNNILLDENLKAKIVFLPPNRNDEDTGIQFWKCGKDSYIDPKYKDTDILQRQSDVYSFGVVLFEILCGKKANDQVYFKNNKNGLAHVVRELVNWETLEKMIDPIIMKNTSENILVQNIGANRDSLSTFIKTAYYCVAETDDQHPTMRVVIKQLEEALSFQIRNQAEPVFQCILLKLIRVLDACLISCFSCESVTIQEEQIECLNADQVADKLVNASEASSRMLEILEKPAQCLNDYEVANPVHAFEVRSTTNISLQDSHGSTREISLKDIQRATQYFHKDNLIGRGGFGYVYKGNLQGRDGDNTAIAVKRLINKSDRGRQYFKNELHILSHYKHKNIIGLVGYCNEQDEQIIVMNYASNGSLDRHLHEPSLTWVMRLNICIEVASALYFLHGGFGGRAKVIHRDIKTSNILLNGDWKAKLTDFGLSLISTMSEEINYAVDDVCGTSGYYDPVYKKTGVLTLESDIYSFGVVLFEILCGRSTNADFIKKIFKENMQDEVVFEQIRKEIEPKSLKTFQKITYQCLDDKRENRPTIKEVLRELMMASSLQGSAPFYHLLIPLEDVAKATNNFNGGKLTGRNLYGTTYAGKLMLSGKLIAITARRLNYSPNESDDYLYNETSVLYGLKHRNIVSLIGYCDEENEKIIVTKYVARGSLRKYVDKSILTWVQRLRICLGVAHALRYLHNHEERDYIILHCYINSDTILLDANWEAKLSDFEISIKQSVYKKDEVRVCEHIKRMGWVDPAIETTGGVTYKSDIYSFGLLFFEILYGSKSFVSCNLHNDLANLCRRGEDKKWFDVLFRARGMYKKSLDTCLNIASSCLRKDPTRRPDIDRIVCEFEKALQLQLKNNHIWANTICDLEKNIGELGYSTLFPTRRDLLPSKRDAWLLL